MEQRSCPEAVVLKLPSGSEPHRRVQNPAGLVLSHGPQGAPGRRD